MNTRAQACGQALRAEQPRLAHRLVEQQFAREPELVLRYGTSGRERCLEDANHHLSFLAQAVEAGRSELFADYIAWAQAMLARRGVAPEDLARYLASMRELLAAELSPDASSAVTGIIDAGLRALPQTPHDIPSFLDPAAPLAELASDCLALLLSGERRQASERMMSAALAGTPVRELYLEVFQRTQREIGRLWQMNRISVAQEHYATAATQMIMSQLYPLIFSADRRAGTVVVACVAGDLHEIGARMVADLLEMDGWNTHYLGANTPAAGILQTLVDRRAQVLAVSTTIAVHVSAVQSLVEQVRAHPACAGLKILVGGRPFNLVEGLWQQVGADGHARDAGEVVALAHRLVARSA